MHSSTSSFRPLPGGWKSLAIAVVAGGLALGVGELYFRARGFAPTLVDSEALWCRERGRASGDAIALVGSSRTQAGLDPREVSAALGGRDVVQLAVAGANPLPVLRDLAADPAFAGVVVLEYMPRRLLTPDGAATSRMRGYLATCKSPSVLAPIEAALDRSLQRHVALLGPELQLFPLLSYVQHHHHLPAHNHTLMDDDRFTPMFFDPGETAAGEHWDPKLTPAELAARDAELKELIVSLRARGGDVVLYRAPATDSVLADEEARFPAATAVPALTAALGVQVIDFATLPEMQRVHPPDGEHPQAEDVPALSRAFARSLADTLARSHR